MNLCWNGFPFIYLRYLLWNDKRTKQNWKKLPFLNIVSNIDRRRIVVLECKKIPFPLFPIFFLFNHFHILFNHLKILLSSNCIHFLLIFVSPLFSFSFQLSFATIEINWKLNWVAAIFVALLNAFKNDKMDLLHNKTKTLFSIISDVEMKWFFFSYNIMCVTFKPKCGVDLTNL